MDAKILLEHSNSLFGARASLLTLWQNIAENFYPERADFTIERSLGTELGEGLATGVPVVLRRDLGDALGSLLRPTNKAWFKTRVDQWDTVSTEAKAWLEMSEDRQRKAMYHRRTGFVRATKEADHDFATFGQAVIQIRLNQFGNGLIFKCHHLRDCAWSENVDGMIDTFYRKWTPEARTLVQLFKKGLHPDVLRMAEKEPFRKINMLHCVVPNQDDNRNRFPFKSVYLDCMHQDIVEEIPIPIFGYCIPRWETVSGSQYAYSPSVVVGLPDARTMQEMMITLLEAGEKATTPPLLGVQEALRSDVNVMAGGITWVDREYDERLGEVLRPLTIDKSGIPLGMDLWDRATAAMREAFYADKLSLPPLGGPDMTAYEVGQRVQEHIRQTMPLFEPVEAEYNAPMCEMVFDIMMRFGVFGSPMLIPEDIRGADINFQFESPLQDAADKAKAQRYLEATSLIANAVAADPSVAYILDNKKAARAALEASDVPIAWLRTEAEVDKMAEAQAQQEQASALLAQMQQGADVAKTIGITPSPSGTMGTGPSPVGTV